MPLVATRGAASAQGFGEFAQSAAPVYIEDVFNTFLYTGNGSTQTINNGIDLAGKGGLVWTKSRSVATDHSLVDTARGADKVLHSESTAAQVTFADITAFNSNGYSISDVSGWVNTSPRTYVSWTFREQPKFFDVVTYTGNGVDPRAISHNLGSVPGMIVVKRTNSSGSDWLVYHRSLSTGQLLSLNGTFAAYTTNEFTTTAPTSSVFYVANSDAINGSGNTYVAYLFAHNAGGFGLTGTDNVISCGSFSQPDGNNVTVNLGYEPQLVMFKRTDATGNWVIADNMRGMAVSDATTGSGNPVTALRPNSSAAEEVGYGYISPTATGFVANIANPASFIYIAIRRGPMRTPTSGTSVFSPQTSTGVQTTNFVVDAFIGVNQRASPGSFDPFEKSRLQGGVPYLTTSSTAAETGGSDVGFDSNTGVRLSWAAGGVNWYLQRAPGFFDVVCYTGTGSARTVAHNLGVVPELMIVKRRSGVADWPVYSSAVGNTKFLLLNSTGDTITDNVWNNTTPTATEFSVRDQNTVNASGSTYVAYLFATVAGVSKVGSYTGTGTTQVINCGFTGGARFVLIKATSTTGNWLVWDSARGIVAGNDPYLALNSTAAEVTNTDWVDTAASGFELSNAGGNLANSNGVSYIYLAIA